MNQILEEKLNRIIKEEKWKWNFEIKEDGIYGIEITALTKSWQQNLFSNNFFKDDDLTVKIDNLEFPKKSGKRGLFDGEVAWNGNNLKGLKKTNLFLIKLNQGNHILTFLADQKPKIETIKIYKTEDEITFLPKDNFPPEDGNQRQWLTIIICNLSLKSLFIKASVKKGKWHDIFQKDDGDLKLVINGEIQKNQEPKSHKYWYWCGRTLKGNSKVFEKELNLKPDLHYVEFWTDRNPEVEEIKIKFSETEVYPIFILDDIQAYTYKGISGNENYNRFDKEILEAVNFWNKFFFSQKYSPKEPLDPNLVKAMVYAESRIGYWQGGFFDVMQIADLRNPAIHSLKKEESFPANEYISDEKVDHINYSYPEEKLPLKVKTPEESIFWGVRWLYYKAQYLKQKESGELFYPYAREWISWEEAVKKYNSHLEYQIKVLNIYQKGIDPDDNQLWGKKNSLGFQKLSLLLIVGFFVLGFLFFGILRSNFFSKDSLISQTEKILTSSPQYVKIVQKEPLKNNSDFLIGVLSSELNLAKGLVQLNKKGKIIKIFPLPEKEKSFQTWEDKWRLGEYLKWLIVNDINQDGEIEIAVEMAYSGTGQVRPFYIYQFRNNQPELILYLEDAVSKTQLKDFNQDNVFEIEHSFVLDGTGLAGRQLTPWKEIWIWQNGKYQKANNLYPEIYKDLVKDYNKFLETHPDQQSMIYYRPIVECLKEKAQLNIKKTFADGRDCIK